MKVSFKTGIQDGSWDELLEVWQAGDQIERFVAGWSNDHLGRLAPSDAQSITALVTTGAIRSA